MEDLLGRPPITMSAASVRAVEEDLGGKSILITGAAGSIGSEIVRQLARYKPGLLLLCDIAESPLYEIGMEMDEVSPGTPVESIICDVRDRFRMEKVFERYRPQHVYHAAAYKHVPLMEKYPSESVLTNVFGTKQMMDLSVRYGAQVFVMISTDKAVNPVSVMGASKRAAEIYVQSLYEKLSGASRACPRVITTRFGNVIGSSGSVVSVFRKQIERCGKVTVTHPDVIRYFMTIQEACSLVLEAAGMGKGGEIFVFDMGKPVKILDLAKKMIRDSGLTDVEIVFTGLRPGEKLYEEILSDGELAKTCHEKIKIASVRSYDHREIVGRLQALHHYATIMDDRSVVETLKYIVPEFTTARLPIDGR
jgi:FlaA1/EpsC-like NDP-sugar epimerase